MGLKTIRFLANGVTKTCAQNCAHFLCIEEFKWELFVFSCTLCPPIFVMCKMEDKSIFKLKVEKNSLHKKISHFVLHVALSSNCFVYQSFVHVPATSYHLISPEFSCMFCCNFISSVYTYFALLYFACASKINWISSCMFGLGHSFSKATTFLAHDMLAPCCIVLPSFPPIHLESSSIFVQC